MSSIKMRGVSILLLCILFTCDTCEAVSAIESEAATNFNFPSGVATDRAGNVYVADTVNSTIRKITPRGVVTTLAGTAKVIGHADGTGAAAKFDRPSIVASDSVGNVYVSDTNNHTIRKITTTGEVTTLAGTAGVKGHADGKGKAASFHYPSGVAADSVGNVYVADSYNNIIRKITPVGEVTTLAGTAGVRGNADGTGKTASFVYPKGVATDNVGNIFVTDALDNTIRKITPAGIVTTVAGTAGLYGSSNGVGLAASFNGPSGIAIDSAGHIYVADYGNSQIRKITQAGVVTTLATSLIFPEGIAIDSTNNIYVANTGDGTIRKITPTGEVTILASTSGVPPIKRDVQTIPEEVEQYSRELNIIIANPKVSGGIEEVLRMGQAASRVLLMPLKDSKKYVIDSLSNEAFQTVLRKMKGFLVNREETYYAEPDPDFFITLAKRSEDQANIEFFDAYKKTRPGTWPVYIDQQTDYSGCIKFGTMTLVDTYSLWDSYSKRYPTRYRSEVKGFIRDVEDDLTDGVCACDNKESTLREFDAFIRTFPHAKISMRLRERVEQIHQGKSKIREYCRSG